MRALVLFCAFAFPFSIAVAVNGATITTGLIALGVLSLHMFFWYLFVDQLLRVKWMV